MADDLVYKQPSNHDALPRSQKSTLIKAPPSTLPWQTRITLGEPLWAITKITFICEIRNIPKCKLFQFFQLNYTLSKQTSSSNILKWFNMHSGWPGHGFSKTSPKVKPGKKWGLIARETFSPACSVDQVAGLSFGTSPGGTALTPEAVVNPSWLHPRANWLLTSSGLLVRTWGWSVVDIYCFGLWSIHSYPLLVTVPRISLESHFFPICGLCNNS